MSHCSFLEFNETTHNCIKKQSTVRNQGILLSFKKKSTQKKNILSPRHTQNPCNYSKKRKYLSLKKMRYKKKEKQYNFALQIDSPCKQKLLKPYKVRNYTAEKSQGNEIGKDVITINKIVFLRQKGKKKMLYRTCGKDMIAQRMSLRLGINRSNIQKVSPPIRIKQSLMKSNKLIKTFVIEMYIIAKVDNNQTFRCNFLLFHIPFALVLAQVLASYNSGSQKLYISQLLKMEIKKINHLKNQVQNQLEEIECIDCLATVLNYKNGQKSCHRIKMAFKAFLKKYETKMLQFMPVYYSYFKLIADKEQLLPEGATIAQIQNLIDCIQQKLKKYHNDRY